MKAGVKSKADRTREDLQLRYSRFLYWNILYFMLRFDAVGCDEESTTRLHGFAPYLITIIY